MMSDAHDRLVMSICRNLLWVENTKYRALKASELVFVVLALSQITLQRKVHILAKNITLHRDKMPGQKPQKIPAMAKGLAIGMATCVLTGIAVSEFGGVHSIIPFSIIMGSTVGIILGTVLEIKNRKRKSRSYWNYWSQTLPMERGDPNEEPENERYIEGPGP